MRSARIRSLPLLLVLASLAACKTDTPPLTQPTGVTTAPLATATPLATPTPAATPSGAPSDLPSSGPSASAGPSLAPGVLFRDDFDGLELDAGRWTAFEKTGIIRVKDGVLDLASPGVTRDFPLVIANGEILPAEGPWYFEISYKALTVGRPLGFQLDFLPPEGPDDQGVSQPFMNGLWFQTDLVFAFRSETTNNLAMIQRGTLKPNTPHRVRIESDGVEKYRGIIDTTEYLTFPSKRKPRRFWMGDYPNKPVGATNWARIQIDYVEVGVLSEPDPATPKPAVQPAS